MQHGSALLLHQTLKDNIGSGSNKATLAEIGVLKMTEKKAIDILERRIDISAYWNV